MRTKYKSGAIRYKARLKKAPPPKAVITSPYALGEEEMNSLKKQFPRLNDVPIENNVKPGILAGIIIKIGSHRIDLSLSSGLINLKQYLYEYSR